MRQKHTIQSKLKKVRESKIKHTVHNKTPSDRSKLLETLDQMKSIVAMDEATRSFLYPNKRHVPELHGNELNKSISKIYIQNIDREEEIEYISENTDSYLLVNQSSIRSPQMDTVFDAVDYRKETFEAGPDNWPLAKETNRSPQMDIFIYEAPSIEPIPEEWIRCFANHKYTPRDLPNLFHKYVLELAMPSADYQYTIVQEPTYLLSALGIEPIVDLTTEPPITYDCIPVIKNRVCMIHCYSLKQFNRMFHDYFHVLETAFDVVVCFCIDDPIVRELSPNTVFIKIPNFGMDIASKFIAIHYLQSIGYEYEYIFYIHSKTDDMKRHEYIQPFIKNMSKIVDIMIKASVGGIFHDSIYYGTEQVDWYQMSNSPSVKDDITWGRNECYLHDIAHYMNLPENLFFPEGNFYILHKDVANEIYTDKNLYNILNTQESFDYNWVNVFYALDATYDDAYSEYKTRGFFGNNVQTQLGYRAMADCMTEHMFERIIFSVILKLQRKIEIVSQYRLNKKTECFLGWMNHIIDPSYSMYKSHKLSRDLHTALYKKPNLTIIACHTYDNTKIDILLHNIAYFMEFSDRIIVVNSAEFQETQHDVICEKIRAKYPNICINNVMTESQLLE